MKWKTKTVTKTRTLGPPETKETRERYMPTESSGLLARLRGSIAYLAGPIDDALDQGVGWRRDFIRLCNEKHHMGIKFLDPTNKLTGLKKEVEEEQEKIRRFREEGDWESLKQFMNEVVHHDHRCVDISDFIVVYVNRDIHMCGTYFELQAALEQKKPYFIFVNCGKKRAPNWLFGVLDHNYIFNDLSEVVDKLYRLHTGQDEMSWRWVLIRKELAKL